MTKSGNGYKANELPLSAGEEQLIKQLRDIMDRMNAKPYQVSVLVVDGTWYIYESVPRGKVKQA